MELFFKPPFAATHFHNITHPYSIIHAVISVCTCCNLQLRMLAEAYIWCRKKCPIFSLSTTTIQWSHTFVQSDVWAPTVRCFIFFCITIFSILLAECKCQVHRETGERGLMCISHLQLSTIRKNRLLSKDFSRGSCEMSTLSSTTYLFIYFLVAAVWGTNTMQLQEKLPLSPSECHGIP